MDASSRHQNIEIAAGFNCRYRPAVQGINQPFALCLDGQVGIMAIRITWGCLRVAFFFSMIAPYAEIRARISETRHAVVRGPSFTGLG